MYVHHGKEDKLETGRSLPTTFPLARPRTARRFKPIALVSGFCAFVLVIRLFTSSYNRSSWPHSERPHNSKRRESTTSQTRPIVVLPATRPNRDFCRTLFSLLINGYDPPVVVRSAHNLAYSPDFNRTQLRKLTFLCPSFVYVSLPTDQLERSC